MPAARPLVNVYNGTTGQVVSSVPLPAVLQAPIRNDLVNFVHTNIAKNHRQAYAASTMSGHQTSAESWGTGRAVARIPRVAGGGTHRAGQGAYANMCRGGRLFAPTPIWRRWHRKVNVTLKRHAICAALAASAVPALVSARGHRIDHIPEVPLVVSTDSITAVKKTKQAVALLRKIHAHGDVLKVIASKKLRAGKGKWRNRRYRQRSGPLIVFGRRTPMVESFRNLPGVDLVQVGRLNLLKLAPGGHLGRFVIWTQDAFAALDNIYGTYTKPSNKKHGYTLPRAKMLNTNLRRIMQSENVRACLRPRRHTIRFARKRNPLRNFHAMAKLNPHAVALKRAQLLYQKMVQRRKQSLRLRKQNAEKKRKLIAKDPKAKKEFIAKEKARKAKDAERRKKKVAVVKKAKQEAKDKKQKYARKSYKVITGQRFTAIKNRDLRRRFNRLHHEQRKNFYKFLFA